MCTYIHIYMYTYIQTHNLAGAKQPAATVASAANKISAGGGGGGVPAPVGGAEGVAENVGATAGGLATTGAGATPADDGDL